MAFKVPKLASADLVVSSVAKSTTAAASREALALTVLAAVLDGYSGARLERALVQGKGQVDGGRVADSAGASNGLMGRGPQLFTLDGVPAEGKTTEQVADALRQQVALIAREGVSQAELQRVKTQWVASETYKLDSVFSQARELGARAALGCQRPLDYPITHHHRRRGASRCQQILRRRSDDASRLDSAGARPQAQAAPISPSSAALSRAMNLTYREI
jgi:zinc protease